MDEDSTPESVMCFQHCQKDVDILCFQVPETCPVCDEHMESSPIMEMPPFRLPTPFTNGASSPFSLLIRPTNGTFLLDYKNSVDLHVGITDSRGTVFDFDGDGLHASTVRWNHCISIMLEPRGNEAALNWDTKLQEFAMKPEWQASQYNEESRNCYHFVINFLQYYGLTSYPADSDQFCEEVILPRTIQAAKFIGLYRKLMQDGLIINHRKNNNQTERKTSVDAQSEHSELSADGSYEIAETQF